MCEQGGVRSESLGVVWLRRVGQKGKDGTGRSQRTGKASTPEGPRGLSRRGEEGGGPSDTPTHTAQPIAEWQRGLLLPLQRSMTELMLVCACVVFEVLCIRDGGREMSGRVPVVASVRHAWPVLIPRGDTHARAGHACVARGRRGATFQSHSMACSRRHVRSAEATNQMHTHTHTLTAPAFFGLSPGLPDQSQKETLMRTLHTDSRPGHGQGMLITKLCRHSRRLAGSISICVDRRRR